MRVVIALAVLALSADTFANGAPEQTWKAAQLIDIGLQLSKNSQATLAANHHINPNWRISLCEQLRILNYELKFWYDAGEILVRDPYEFSFDHSDFYDVDCREGLGRQALVERVGPSLAEKHTLKKKDPALWGADKFIEIGLNMSQRGVALVPPNRHINIEWRIALCEQLQHLGFHVQFWFEQREQFQIGDARSYEVIPEYGYYHVACKVGGARNFRIYRQDLDFNQSQASHH